MPEIRKEDSQWPVWVPLIPHLPNLTELEVGWDWSHAAALTAVGQHCRHLRALQIRLYETGIVTLEPVDAALRVVAQGCSKLEVLNLDVTVKISD
jgi:hypothetical protein